MGDFQAYLNLMNLSQGGDYWKTFHILILSQLKSHWYFPNEMYSYKEVSYYHKGNSLLWEFF